MIALQKLWKMLFISSKRLFSFLRYSNFSISTFCLFLPVSHCLRAWLKINLNKVYDIINCLSKNLITHFVWYLEKEKRYEVETLTIDTDIKLGALNKGHFYGKSCRKCAPKASPRSCFILVNSPKQPLHARNSFKNKKFGKGIIKNL